MIHDELIPKEAHVYPVHTGKKLLGLGSYQSVLKEISAIVKLDIAHDETCYQQLIEQYADFVQLLSHPLSAVKESMLSRSVKRAYIMLREFARCYEERYGSQAIVSESGSRLLYGVFSAALLFEVGCICTERRIILCDTHGRYRAQWQYFDRPMHHYGQYYKVRFGKGMNKRLTTEVTYLLAKQIMPNLGFAWLSEDQVVLQQWFRALNIRDEFFGAYKIELDIDKVIVEDPLALDDIPDECFVPEETLAGEKYWEWLKEKMKEADASISQPDSAIQIVKGDVLLDHNRLLTEFGRVFSRYRDSIVVGAQFNHLGLCQLDGQDYKFTQYYSKPAGKIAGGGVAATGLYAQGHSSHGQGETFSQAQHQGVHAEQSTRSYVQIDRNDARVYFPNIESLPENTSLVPVERSSPAGIFQRLVGAFSIGALLQNNLGRGA